MSREISPKLRGPRPGRKRSPLDRSSITRWRNRMGEERLEALLQESLAVVTRTGTVLHPCTFRLSGLGDLR
jgi:hypothetical protein